jgi:hypothetical protein
MPGVNRDWNVWCSISGADPGDKDQMKSFNFDRRVARLAGHEAEIVREAAVDSWKANPGCTMSVFLDLWVAEVNVRADVGDPVVATVDQPIVDAAAAVGKVGREAERRRGSDAQQASRQSVRHLYNITSLDNLASIMASGILCHDAVEQLSHVDMSDAGVQERREGKRVQGWRLHSYASLYFNPRNAMLFRLCREFPTVVVLRVSSEVLGLPGVVVTDGNAASRRTRNWLARDGILGLDLDRVYSREWANDEDLKRVTQAEVLVPQKVPPPYLVSAITSSDAFAVLARRACPWLHVDVDGELFFGR